VLALGLPEACGVRVGMHGCPIIHCGLNNQWVGLSMPMRLTMHPLMLHIDKSSGEYEQQPAPTKTLCSDNV